MTLTMTYRTSFTSVRTKTSSPIGKTTKTRRARTEPRRIEVEFEFNDANQESALDRTWRKEKKSKSTVNNATHNTETTSAPTASRRIGRPHHAPWLGRTQSIDLFWSSPPKGPSPRPPPRRRVRARRQAKSLVTRKCRCWRDVSERLKSQYRDPQPTSP